MCSSRKKNNVLQLELLQTMERGWPFGHRQSRHCRPHIPMGEDERALPSNQDRFKGLDTQAIEVECCG